jgi:hypothetical protein
MVQKNVSRVRKQPDTEKQAADFPSSGKARPSRFKWLEADEVISGPLEPTPWVIEALELGPGRPCAIWGIGGSGKSWLATEIGRAVATGTPVFGRYEVSQGIVWHLSYELGARTVKRRYRALAAGRGQSAADFAGHLRVTALPKVFLNTPDALEAFMKACEGVSLVIIDSFRRAIPGADENDSSVSQFLDLLTKVSEATGATFLLIHHVGKAHQVDERLSGRGSSAILDGSGCIWVLKGSGDQLRTMKQIRPHDDGEGECAAFKVDRTNVDGHPIAPVRLSVLDVREKRSRIWRALKEILATGDHGHTALIEHVMEKTGFTRSAVRDRVANLVSSGRLLSEVGARNKHVIRLRT